MTQIDNDTAKTKTKTETCDRLTVSKIILDFMKENKVLIGFYFATIVLLPIQDVGLPHCIGMLTKSIHEKHDISYPLGMIIALVCLIQIGYIILEYLDTMIFPRFQRFIREELLNRIMIQNDTKFEELRIGELLMRLTKVPFAIYGYVTVIKAVFLPAFLVYTFAIIYFSVYDPLLGLGLFTLIILMIIAISYTIKSCSLVSTTRDSAHNTMNEKIDDILRNLVSVLNTSQQSQELKIIDGYQQKYADLTEKTLTCSSKLRYIFVPLVLVYFAYFNIRMYKQVKANKLSSYTFVPMLLILLYIMNSLWSMMGNVSEMVLRSGVISESIGSFDICSRVISQIDKSDVDEDSLDASGHPDTNEELEYLRTMNVNSGEPILRIRDAMYTYTKKALPGQTQKEARYTLDKFNIDFLAGQRTLIIGKIGSGKSTILKLLLKYQMLEAGEIYYGDMPYSSLSSRSIRKRIAYIPQMPVLFDRTIYDNIVYGVESEVSQEQIMELVKNAGLGDMFAKFELGLDTPVGKYGSFLSGGQRQIVWIIRALLQRTEIAILDEPTSAIDDDTKGIVRHLLETFMAGKTVIMVTHDPYLEKLADRIIELSDGKIKSDKMV
jgi:ATP-binding cassette subfamily B protein